MIKKIYVCPKINMFKTHKNCKDADEIDDVRV